MIEPISAEDCLPLRSKVLRGGKPADQCGFKEDGQEGSFHLGYYDNGKLVGIASFYAISHENIEEKGIQLRGMAVDPEYQGKGIGKKIIKVAETKIASLPEITHIWCNARKIAYEFYKSLGFDFTSEEFDIPTVGLHRIMLKNYRTEK